MSLLMGVLLLYSCENEYFQLDRLSDEIELETDLVAPLIHGSLSMRDLVAWFDSSGYVGELEDGLVYLSYADTLIDILADTLDLLVDGLYTEIYFDTEVGSDPLFMGSGIGDIIHFRKSKFFRFEATGTNRCDSTRFKGGELITDLECTFLHSGYLTVSSPYILDNNQNPYSHTMLISDASGSFNWSDVHSLDGYTITTDRQGDSSVFRMDYDLALINSGNPVNPGDYCEISSSFEDMGFYSFFGLIDPEEYLMESGEIDIPIYADFPELSHLKLADPRINIAIENSLGIPFELEIDSVIATAEDGSTETLVYYEGHPFIIPAPGIDMVGETVYEEYHINNQTTNFQDLINLAPHTLSYRVRGDIGSQSQNHFLLDTSRFMAEAEVMVPLDLSFSEYALVDTLEFALGDEGIDTTVIKEVDLFLGTTNHLPLRLALQVYLMDEFHTVFDSLFTSEPPLLAPSVVDADGVLVSPSEKESVVHFPAEKISKLDRTQYLKIEARLVTSGSGDQFVKFYSEYSLDFEISVYADLIINTREL
jgi:hypothetical protein